MFSQVTHSEEAWDKALKKLKEKKSYAASFRNDILTRHLAFNSEAGLDWP